MLPRRARLQRRWEHAVSSNSSSRIICFSTFEVNLQTGELRQQGQKVKLQEQPFQVLVALLERPGEVVTREELRSKLWPADTFVDFDHSLNAAIRRFEMPWATRRKRQSSLKHLLGEGIASLLRLTVATLWAVSESQRSRCEKSHLSRIPG